MDTVYALIGFLAALDPVTGQNLTTYEWTTNTTDQPLTDSIGKVQFRIGESLVIFFCEQKEKTGPEQ